MAINDGGPAFPQGEKYVTTDFAGGRHECSKGALYKGMTLRDWLAGHALAGYLASFANRGDGPMPSREEATREAYLYADEMMIERVEPKKAADATN